MEVDDDELELLRLESRGHDLLLRKTIHEQEIQRINKEYASLNDQINAKKREVAGKEEKAKSVKEKVVTGS